MTKRLYGIDGCRGGWIVAEGNEKLEGFVFRRTEDLGLFFAEAGPDCLIAIDIPIGLPVNESRACDLAARKLLGSPRGSSVFPAPARHAMDASTREEADRLNREALNTGISKQAFCIIPKIREVDALMDRQRQRYIREAHPEVTFAQLNGRPMMHNKKTATGRLERLGVLNSVGIAISQAQLMEERGRFPATHVALDDLLDALACLVTAFHIQAGRGLSLGHSDQRDAKQLVMEIVTCVRAAEGAKA
jgi:predicted RNase H-like nuclease